MYQKGGELTITRDAMMKTVDRLESVIVDENKLYMEAKVSVSGVLKAFNIEASATLGYEKTSTATEEKERIVDKALGHKGEAKWKLKPDEFVLTVASMNMYVYKTEDGKIGRTIASNNNLIYNTVVGPETAKNQSELFDNSFDFLKQHKIPIKTYTHQDLQDMIVRENADDIKEIESLTPRQQFLVEFGDKPNGILLTAANWNCQGCYLCIKHKKNTGQPVGGPGYHLIAATTHKLPECQLIVKRVSNTVIRLISKKYNKPLAVVKRYVKPKDIYNLETVDEDKCNDNICDFGFDIVNGGLVLESLGMSKVGRDKNDHKKKYLALKPVRQYKYKYDIHTRDNVEALYQSPDEATRFSFESGDLF